MVPRSKGRIYLLFFESSILLGILLFFYGIIDGRIPRYRQVLDIQCLYWMLADASDASLKGACLLSF